MTDQTSQKRWPVWAALNAALLLPPLLVFLIYSQRDEFVYDFAYAMAAKWALATGLACSAAIWAIALGMRSWKRSSDGASRSYRFASGIITGLALAVVTTILTLGVAEILSPLYLPAFNELSGVHQVEDDPELLYTLKPNSRHRYRVLTTGETVEYRINSHGYRGEEFEWEKSDDVIRVLVIGDSMAFGQDTNIEDTLAVRLERKLNSWAEQATFANRFEVINAGVSGYNTWNEVNFLARRGLALDPDIVVFQFCFNDVGDPISLISSVSYFSFKSLPEAMFPSPESVRLHEETILTINRKTMSLKTALLFTLRKHSRLFGYFNRAWEGRRIQQMETALRESEAGIRSLEEDEAPHFERSYFHGCLESLADATSSEFAWLRENLQRLKAISNEADVPVIFLIPPIRHQLSENRSSYRQAIENVEALALGMGFEVCSPIKELKRQAAGNPFSLFIGYDEVHYNGKGNDILAGEILRLFQAMADDGKLAISP